MKIIRESIYEEIIGHLEFLGSFDQEDTAEVIKPHNYFYLVELTEDEFLNNVFLSSDSVRHFVPEGEDRKLRDVADNAKRNIENNENLGEGRWNLTRIITKTEDWIRSKSSPSIIVIRDLKNGELEIQDAFKYIHDGCQRSLGYAIKILSGEVKYKKKKAYLATNIEEKIDPKGLGFAAVASLWLWGAMALFTPAYFGFTSSGWSWLLYIIGTVLLLISFGGALIELGNLIKNEAFSYWGVSLVFLIPALLLFILIQQQILFGGFILISKIAAMLLLTIGGPMFFHGISYLFLKEGEKEKTTPIQEETKRKTSLEIVGNILIALFSLTTAIVALVKVILE